MNTACCVCIITEGQRLVFSTKMENRAPESKRLLMFFKVFKALCMLTGQYPMRDVSGRCQVLKKFCLFIVITVFFIIVLFNFVFNILAVACVFPGCEYHVESPVKSHESQSSPPLTVEKYKNIERFVFICTSASGILSYALMLVSLNCCFKNNNERIKPLFNEANVSKLKVFTILLVLNFVCTCGSVPIFIAIMWMKINWHGGAIVVLDVFGLTTHIVSWVCSLLGCFVFSKVAYDVAHKCRVELYNNLTETPDRSLEDLIAIDQRYVKTMRASLVPFSYWFAVHWLAYCLTTFLCISYVVQNIQHDMYVPESECYKEPDHTCRLLLTYHILYAIGHAILFLYPCFRAAALTSVRANLICRITRENWNMNHLRKRQAFLHYLQVQDCSFKVNILCTSITFGSNLAYFSVFAGIMTVALRIAL